jgi:SAM-dependent methyltransferase
VNFRDFEHAGWEGVAARYHDAFARLTSQAIGPLLDAAGARPGVKLLDVASGPGYVAAVAAEQGAEALGVDFASSMVELASERYPGVKFQQGDAESLPFPDASFDAVTMNFGVLHLANPDRALEEAHRVLRPSGRLAFTAWAAPEQTRGYGVVLDAIGKFGRSEVGLPPGPPFFRFGDPAEARRSLEAAGFGNAQTRILPLAWRLESTAALFEWMMGGTVRTGALLRAQTPAALESIRQAVGASAARFLKGHGVEIPMPAVLASATKRSA